MGRSCASIGVPIDREVAIAARRHPSTTATRRTSPGGSSGSGRHARGASLTRDRGAHRVLGETSSGSLDSTPLTGEVLGELPEITIYPATHYVASDERMKRAIASIEEELADRLGELERGDRLLEAERLRMRTNYDLEMLREVGFCSGIENYSRHIDGREPGTAPYTLLDYFPDDYLCVIDESHVTVPQIGGMYEGDMSRKGTLVDFGFRLPSARDNAAAHLR